MQISSRLRKDKNYIDIRLERKNCKTCHRYLTIDRFIVFKNFLKFLSPSQMLFFSLTNTHIVHVEYVSRVNTRY